MHEFTGFKMLSLIIHSDLHRQITILSSHFREVCLYSSSSPPGTLMYTLGRGLQYSVSINTWPFSISCN
jgi:hypothetical protein